MRKRFQGGVVVPLFNNYVFATSDRIGHGELAGNWDLDGSKLTERWWFAQGAPVSLRRAVAPVRTPYPWGPDPLP